jgi:NAD(P)-dependent dehydrogenase (short-subunit alcohol dehydrogenase family)
MKEFYADKVAVVTGGASGIGLAMTKLMLEFGAGVIIADINETKLNTEATRLAVQYPGKIFGKKTDISKAHEVEDLVDYAVEKGGRLDFMFNNAGLPLMKPFDEISMEDWKLAFDVNFYGALYGTRAALRVMRTQGGVGHIANTASGIVFSPMPLQAMYSATKAALHGLTLALRAEIWDENIFLHSVIPGTVATPIWGGDQVPEGAITPEESARVILEKVKDNMRIVFVDPRDMEGAKKCNHPDLQPQIDDYFKRVTAARKGGNLCVV